MIAPRTLRKIVSVNTSDRGGGAERIAWNLFKGYQRRGIDSWLIVGDKKSDDPNVLPLFLSPHFDYRPCPWRLRYLRQRLLKPACRRLGIEDFESPYTWHLLALTGAAPDLVHCHNLHGNYFDLRALTSISQRVPVFLSLHDSWALTGHCAYPVRCERWQSGCGHCPDLTLPPAVERDATRFNWRRKARIYARSRLYVSTPSNWLMERVRRSMLAPAIVDSRVIPNGVDLRLFRPTSKRDARARLALPTDGYLLAFAATQAVSNTYKDYPTIRAALEILARQPLNGPIHFAAIGAAGQTERMGDVTIHHLPYVDQDEVARYFQAADLYVHASEAEAFGLVVAEAMACGAPVVATATGGLSELIGDGETGVLVPPQNPQAMAEAIRRLLEDPDRRSAFGENAARHARSRFDEERMIEAFVDWFAQAVG